MDRPWGPAFRFGRKHGPTLLVLTAVALAALAPSCVNPTPKQYRVLTFFFDGVPDPNAVAVDDSGTPIPAADKGRQVSQASFHPKKGGWQCKSCHGQFDNQLKAEPAELCKQCHTRAKFPKGKLHGPLNVGACIACHDPHRSLSPHLLRLSVPELCMGCHEKTITYQQIDEHIEKNGSECTRCHNPHGSSRDAFLRSSYVRDDVLPEGLLHDATLERAPEGEGAASNPPATSDTQDTTRGPDEGVQPGSSEGVPKP